MYFSLIEKFVFCVRLSGHLRSMTHINLTDEVARQFSFIFAMLEAVHPTRFDEMLDAAFPNAVVENSDDTLVKYWRTLRENLLEALECQGNYDATRIFIELVRRRLIHLEDLDYMLTSESLLFHGFEPFACRSHYEMFLDIQELLMAFVYGLGPRPTNIVEKLQNIGGKFFGNYNQNKIFNFTRFTTIPDESLHLLFEQCNIRQLRSTFLHPGRSECFFRYLDKRLRPWRE